MSMQIHDPYAPRKGTGKMAFAKRGGAPLTSGTKEVPRGRFGFTDGGTARMSSLPVVASNGELNATNKRELMQAIQALATLARSGQIQTVDGVGLKNDPGSLAEVQAERARTLEEASSDKTGNAWQALGDVIGDEIWITLGREGFARKTLMTKPIKRTEDARLKVRNKDVASFMVTNNPNVVAQQIRQFYVYPPDYYILTRILIEDKEIEQSPGDILEEKYQDGLEAHLVQEDNVWLRLARQAAPVENDLFYFNTFTPTIFSSMRTQIARWGLPVTSAIIAFDLWDDIIADPEFSSWFDPVSKHEIVLEGSLGGLLGVNIITDAFRHETLRVLGDGELFFCSAPSTLGGITQRKELTAKEIDTYNLGSPNRGWFLEQIQGTAFVNSRGIAQGQRT